MKEYDKTLYNIRLAFSYRDLIRTRCKPLFQRMIKSYHRSFVEGMHTLNGKDKINVAFFLTIPGMWKADYVFKAMQQHPLFHPYVVILPYSSFKGFRNDEIVATLDRTETFIKSKGFEYIIPYDKDSSRWMDIKKDMNPDMVFFSSPYKDNIPEYYIYHYKDKPTFYIPYGITSMNCYKTNYDLVFPNLVGCHFVETPMHIEFAKTYGRSNAVNYCAVGCPGAEVYMRDDYQSPDVWKPQEKTKKRIIWAPHHSIDVEGGLNISTFLIYCDDMLRLAEKYQDEIQIAFKPHQTLKYKLELLWGREKTFEYYQKWEKLPNGQLEEAGYTDLFIHSDAMIHDSGSFTSEYMFLNKPVMYLIKNEEKIRDQFNEFGIKAFEQHYPGNNLLQLEEFVKNVVIAGNDSMSEGRKLFYEEYLVSREGMLPSERIVDYILRTINA